MARAAILCSLLFGCHRGMHELRCQDRVDINANVPVEATTLNGATIAVCRNGDCLRTEARMISPTSTTLWSVTAPADARPNLGDGLVVFTTPKGSVTGLHVIMHPVNPSNRDVWRMAVVDHTGSTVLDASRSAVHIRENGACRRPNWTVDLAPTWTADLSRAKPLIPPPQD